MWCPSGGPTERAFGQRLGQRLGQQGCGAWAARLWEQLVRAVWRRLFAVAKQQQQQQQGILCSCTATWCGGREQLQDLTAAAAPRLLARREWFDEAAFAQALNEHGIQVGARRPAGTVRLCLAGALQQLPSLGGLPPVVASAARQRGPPPRCCVRRQVVEGRARDPVPVGIKRFDSQSQPFDALITFMKKRTRQHIRCGMGGGVAHVTAAQLACPLPLRVCGKAVVHACQQLAALFCMRHCLADGTSCAMLH